MAELKILFGATLRQRRKAKGLSQVTLAERAGVSLETVARVERGQSGASFEVVERLAAALDVKPTALFGVDPAGDGDTFDELLLTLAALDPKRLAWIKGVVAAALNTPG